MKYGRLTILEKDLKRSKNRRTYYICKCDCGTIKSIRYDCLTDKKHPTISCGCYSKEHHIKKHNQSRTRFYHIWASMKDRCNNPNNKQYKYYGGRGIRVYDDWNGPYGWECFRDWAISNGYQEGLTIDRIDVNGNYEPNNCRWITQSEQANNTRRNVLLTYNNETHNINQWANILGINKNTFWSLVRKKKYSIKDIVEKYNCKV